MASQIASPTVVYSNVYAGADKREHPSSALLAFLRGIHRSPVNSPHKGPVTWKCFHLMTSSWETCVGYHCLTFYRDQIRRRVSSWPFYNQLWTLSLTRIIFNPSWISHYFHYEILHWACNHLSILGLLLSNASKMTRRKWVFYWACNYSSMLGLVLIPVCKMSPSNLVNYFRGFT